MGQLLAHPVVLIDAAVQGAGRKDNDKILAVFDIVQDRVVEVAAFQAVDIEENAVSLGYQNIPQVLGGLPAVFSAVADENVVMFFSFFHTPPRSTGKSPPTAVQAVIRFYGYLSPGVSHALSSYRRKTRIKILFNFHNITFFLAIQQILARA